ncbi:MAG: tyrosine--tRNA ligase [Candidatus Parcubacteria bacterium]|nr:tyrosine--tRNA ligase [Candidatus Parcubacteria bacterium]
MSISKNKDLIQEIITRGVNEVIDAKHLVERLNSGKQLIVKLGIDPTSPNIHLGRAVPLLKLRDFQNLGHKVIFIVGDATALVGDTSDKSAERPMLPLETVKKNLQTYIEQASKILDKNKLEVRFNSEWLNKLGYLEIGPQADQFSLAEFMSRENIKKRYDEGKRVSLRELLYPLMQGYDSVMIKADVEIGGTDQRFNLLAGRTLQSYYHQEPQDIIMGNLILGTDGRKMSSSWGNTINIVDEPPEMFGKVMSIPDDLIIIYFEHCTRLPMVEVKAFEKELQNEKTNPRDIKMILAKEIVKTYWSESEALEAEKYFVSVFQKKETPDEIIVYKLAGKNIIDVLILSKLADSKSEARRLINQKSIKINDEVIDSSEIVVSKNSVIQKGKRYFIKVE